MLSERQWATEWRYSRVPTTVWGFPVVRFQRIGDLVTKRCNKDDFEIWSRNLDNESHCSLSSLINHLLLVICAPNYAQAQDNKDEIFSDQLQETVCAITLAPQTSLGQINPLPTAPKCAPECIWVEMGCYQKVTNGTKCSFLWFLFLSRYMCRLIHVGDPGCYHVARYIVCKVVHV